MQEFTDNERDSLMRASYYMITKNFTKTVNKFIVYKEGTSTIDIPHGIGQRSMFIDLLIEYFIVLEEYEKCEKLTKLKELVIMAGD